MKYKNKLNGANGGAIGGHCYAYGGFWFIIKNA